jgi:cysteinyl-tRNA synthetase
MNITDVGHLVGDADDGEDKIAVGAKKEKTTPQEIADRYAKRFLEDITLLNVDTQAMRFPRATEYIEEDIALIRELEKKGLTYLTKSGVYFDTEKFPNYGKLHGLKTIKLIGGARVIMDDGRKNVHDFALWRFAKSGDLQQWNSPWGRGNPGWSIECSAMAMTLLGAEIDIHTGGEDLASIHHNNEIAQSEGATDRAFVRYWLHGAFLSMSGEKMSKSLGNVFTLKDVVARGFHPLALRYLFLQANYRSPIDFSWEALSAADEALRRLWRQSDHIGRDAQKKAVSSETSRAITALLREDLSTPQAIALLYSALQNDALTHREVWGVIEAADQVLGLSLLAPPEEMLPVPLFKVPQNIQRAAKEREEARKAKDFSKADQLRIHIEKSGYHVDDTPSGPLFTAMKKE